MNAALILGVVVTGFLGSWHCGAMCGPLSCQYKKAQDFWLYHAARLLTYILLTSLFYMGMRYLMNVDSRPIKMAASLFLGVVFILFAFKQYGMIQTPAFDFKIFKWVNRNSAWAQKRPQLYALTLGVLTGFLPCGWLYSFVLLASQAKTYPMSILLIVLFWATSLPAFFVLRSLMTHLINKSSIKNQKISVLVLALAGLLSILGHWIHL